VAFCGWAATYGWQLWPLSSYQFFPLLGLLAFSIMWSHYMMTAVRTYWRLPREVLAKYFRWTGYAVLVLICLHPGILVYQRFRDGFGLPPHSYETYVAPSMAWVTLLGTASLLVFLAFELRRFYGNRSWWHYVADASDIAMLAIVYHALRIGSSLQAVSWFRMVWYVYLITLLFALGYKYGHRYATRRANLL
jgi:hypothetical protein